MDYFKFIIDKVQDTLTGWQSSLVSQSRKLTLIKSVIAALPLYLCSTYKLLLSLCDKLCSVSPHFGGKLMIENPYLSSLGQNISLQARGEGLRILDYRLLNQALLTKQC